MRIIDVGMEVYVIEMRNLFFLFYVYLILENVVKRLYRLFILEEGIYIIKFSEVVVLVKLYIIFVKMKFSFLEKFFLCFLSLVVDCSFNV